MITYQDEAITNTLRAIKNGFWTHPVLVEQCVQKGLARLSPLGLELTADGSLKLRTSDTLDA